MPTVRGVVLFSDLIPISTTVERGAQRIISQTVSDYGFAVVTATISRNPDKTIASIAHTVTIP